MQVWACGSACVAEFADGRDIGVADVAGADENVFHEWFLQVRGLRWRDFNTASRRVGVTAVRRRARKKSTRRRAGKKTGGDRSVAHEALPAPLVAYAARRRSDRDCGLVAALALAGTIVSFVCSGAVLTDTALAATVTFAVVAFWEALHEEGAPCP